MARMMTAAENAWSPRDPRAGRGFAATLDALLRDALAELSPDRLSRDAAAAVHRRLMGAATSFEHLSVAPAKAWSILVRRSLWLDLVDGKLSAKQAARLDRSVEHRLSELGPVD